MFYTYVLLSQKDNQWYTGYASDLKKRVQQHNKGLDYSSSKRRPFKLIYYEACLEEIDARKRENYLKSGRGKCYLKSRLKRFLLRSGFGP